MKKFEHSNQEFLLRQLDAAAGYFRFPAVQLEVLAEVPFTILIQLFNGSTNEVTDLALCLSFLARKALRREGEYPNLLFRSVELNRLGQILRTGCDVVPSDSPIYAARLGKALEYGGYNKVVQVFDSQQLERTFKKVPKSEARELLDQLRQTYPSMKELDGDWMWFSKLPLDDFRIGTAYEIEYSFFIPRNPLEALLMIFLVGKDPELLREEFQNQLQRLKLDPCTDEAKSVGRDEKLTTSPPAPST